MFLILIIFDDLIVKNTEGNCSLKEKKNKKDTKKIKDKDAKDSDADKPDTSDEKKVEKNYLQTAGLVFIKYCVAGLYKVAVCIVTLT